MVTTAASVWIKMRWPKNFQSDHRSTLLTFLIKATMTLKEIMSFYGNQMFLTHYQMTNLRLVQTEGVGRRQFNPFDENGRKLSEKVENTMGKGEIASYEQFLLFPPCFQKACFPGASKGVIVWEWVKGGLWQDNFCEFIFNPVPHNPEEEGF